ncbi:heme biosynthesis protein HemY [Facilibium subflavum]|uniref:heme biosynthesis protein HemY n=1 Tax=Facilibium subflavum TaxID=2219058 RepID=UPI000E65CD10|nr:heme biosynthesis HemY N-terminal domain-containing protein [Facilibium subflavum]
MKKVFGLIFICILAAAVVFLVLMNPGVVAFFIHGYLIKLPLWLFVILAIAIVLLCFIVVKVLKVLLYGPGHLFSFFHRMHTKKHITLINDMIVSNLADVESYVLKHYHPRLKKDPKFNQVFCGLFWQKLYQQKKLTQLQHDLDHTNESLKQSFIWQFYQALLWMQTDNASKALTLLEHLHQQKPDSQTIIKACTTLYIQQKEHTKALTFLIGNQQHLDFILQVDMVVQIIKGINNINVLQACWHKVPKALQQSTPVASSYAHVLYHNNAQAQAIEFLQHVLSTTLSLKMVRLYFSYKDTASAYTFIKEMWLKTKVDNIPLMLLLLAKAVKYQDWPFLETYLYQINPENLSIALQAQYCLLNASLSEHQSMHHKAQNFRTKAENIILNQEAIDD